jgi:hypothetical protein
MLDNDITRCRGEGNDGYLCPLRNQCVRFKAIAEDLANDKYNRTSEFRSYSGKLCRSPNWPFFWPVEKSQ